MPIPFPIYLPYDDTLFEMCKRGFIDWDDRRNVWEEANHYELWKAMFKLPPPLLPIYRVSSIEGPALRWSDVLNLWRHLSDLYLESREPLVIKRVEQQQPHPEQDRVSLGREYDRVRRALVAKYGPDGPAEGVSGGQAERDLNKWLAARGQPVAKRTTVQDVLKQLQWCSHRPK
jgi:hypothetical protein